MKAAVSWRACGFLAVLLAAACTSTPKQPSPGKGVHIASIAGIETQLHHSIAKPGPGLGAEVIQSGYLDPTAGSTFQGETAAVSYRWRGFVALVRQGTRANGWTLHGAIRRKDGTYLTQPSGNRVALLPSVGSSGAVGYVVAGDWVVTADIAKGAAKSQPSLGDLKTFVNGLTFES